MIEKTDSKIIGIYECEGERGLVQRNGKLFVTPHENPTAESIAETMSKDYQKSTLDGIINQITLTSGFITDNYKQKLLGALTGIQNQELVTQDTITNGLENAINEERLVKLNNISLRVGEVSDKLFIHHVDVNGYYLVTSQGEVVGKAKASKEYLGKIQGNLIKEFYKSLEPYGVKVELDYGNPSLHFNISGMIERGAPIRAIKGSKENLISYSLHGHEWDENKKFRQETLEKIKSIKEAPQAFKEKVKEVLG